MVVTIVLVVAGVLAFWLVAAVALALFIGRAARIGEIKHRDAVFLRDMANGADPSRNEVGERTYRR